MADDVPDTLGGLGARLLKRLGEAAADIAKDVNTTFERRAAERRAAECDSDELGSPEQAGTPAPAGPRRPATLEFGAAKGRPAGPPERLSRPAERRPAPSTARPQRVGAARPVPRSAPSAPLAAAPLAPSLALSPPVAPPAAPIAAPAPSSLFRWRCDESTRLSLFPIQHQDIWNCCKTIERGHWVADEVDMSGDGADFARLSADEQDFIKHQLAFFARIDIDVLDNLGTNFSEEVDCLEAKFAYVNQEQQECVHAEAYANQIEAIVSSTKDRDELFNAVRTHPIIGKMRRWMLERASRNIPLRIRLVLFCAIEGVLFQGPFAALHWLRKRNVLKGVVKANSFIMRDEYLHMQLGACIIKYLVTPPTQAEVEKVFYEAIDVSDEFVDASIPTSGLEGMNRVLMKQYVRFQADTVLMDMGYATMFGVRNPFPDMDKLALNEVSKTNFFEATPTQYQGVASGDAARLAFGADSDDSDDSDD